MGAWSFLLAVGALLPPGPLLREPPRLLFNFISASFDRPLTGRRENRLDRNGPWPADHLAAFGVP
ncbi:hypothetical protein AFFFEF_03103 [Methylorubrum extorquens]